MLKDSRQKSALEEGIYYIGHAVTNKDDKDLTGWTATRVFP